MVSTAHAALAQQDIALDGEWQMTIGGRDYAVNVPHTYNIMEGLEDYAGEAVYEHLGNGYTAFSFDITSYLSPLTSNILEVHTSNAYTDKALPYKRSFDWSNDGGIYRSVRLHVSGKQTLRYVHVTPAMSGAVRFDIRLWNEMDNRLSGRLVVKNRQTGRTEYDAAVSLKKGKNEPQFSTTITINNPQLWHFDQPNLYDFTFEIPGSDALTDHFGFRDFRIENRSFVFNGERVRLPGIEDMPGSNPAYGMAEPRAFIEKTVRTMKDLNTCITRFHYVPDRQMVDMMDEMGILCQLELSWWQQPGRQLTPELRKVAREALEEMIEAYYNHPCIYGWGISNEVSGNHEVCNKIWRELGNDPSLVLDLPTWNEYTGTWHGNNREELPARLQRIREVIGNRPLFITENGLCEPAFTGGDGTRIDDMLYHIKEWQK